MAGFTIKSNGIYCEVNANSLTGAKRKATTFFHGYEDYIYIFNGMHNESSDPIAIKTKLAEWVNL